MSDYIGYVTMQGGNTEVSDWVKTTLKKRLTKTALDQIEVEHILDYLMSESAPQRLRKMSYNQAKLSADKWSKTNQKKGRDIAEGESDVELIHPFDDGSRIVRLLTKAAFQREGFLMAHCVGGYNPNSENVHIYSYRDKKNIPHATFEVQKNGDQIAQIKGKGNGSIHPRYIYPIITFLKKIGINVRSSEMANLGYHHIHEDVVKIVQEIKGSKEKIQEIFGEKYLYWSGKFE